MPEIDGSYIFEGGSQLWSTLRMAGREWRHEERLLGAFRRALGDQSSTIAATYAVTASTVGSTETEAPWRLWVAKPDRARAEFALGAETLVVVVKGRQWWSWSPSLGERSGDPGFQTGLGPGMTLVHPSRLLPLLTSVRLVGHREVAGREGISVSAEAAGLRGDDEPSESVWDAMTAVSTGGVESELGFGASAYELVIDRGLGVLLRTEALLAGEPFRWCEVTELVVDEPMDADLFSLHPRS